MKKFELEGNIIHYKLNPELKIRVVKNDDFDYKKSGNIYEPFKFRGNSFVFLVLNELDPNVNFNLINSILRRAFYWYKSQVYIEKYIPEKEKDNFETERYSLKQSARPGWWICIDRKSKIAIKWKKRMLEETQEVTEVENLELETRDNLLKEMKLWLNKNHNSKIK